MSSSSSSSSKRVSSRHVQQQTNINNFAVAQDGETLLQNHRPIATGSVAVFSVPTTPTSPTTAPMTSTMRNAVGRVIRAANDTRPDDNYEETHGGRNRARVIADQLRGKKRTYDLAFTHCHGFVFFPLGYKSENDVQLTAGGASKPILAMGTDTLKIIMEKIATRLDNAGTVHETICKSLLDIELAIVPILNEHFIFDMNNNQICYRKQVTREGATYFELVKQNQRQVLETIGMDLTIIPNPWGRTKKEKNDGLNLLRLWCNSTGKNAFYGETFKPYYFGTPAYELNVPKGVFNKFYGLKFDAETCLTIWQDEPEPTDGLGVMRWFQWARRSVARWLLHHLYVICRGFRDRFWYSMCWLAKKIREPAYKPNSMLVIFGKEGAGKTSHINKYGKLFGEHYIQYTNLEKNLASFSHPDSDTALLALIDEAHPNRNPKFEAALRNLITAEEINVERKYENQCKVDNYAGHIMISNSWEAINPSASARRFCSLECSRTKQASNSLHVQYMKDYHSGFDDKEFPFHVSCALMGMFMDKDIWLDKQKLSGLKYSEFNDQILPKTTEQVLGQQRAQLQDGVSNFWYQSLHRGFVVHPDDNPLHPANLCSVFNEKDDELAEALRDTILAIDKTGYEMIEDYVYKDNKILQKPDKMWCRVLLERTIYESYRRWHIQYRSSDQLAQPDGETRFWSKTGHIFPSFNKARTSLNAMCTKFVVPHGAFQMTEYRGKHFMDRDINETAAKMKSRFANEHHSFVVMPSMKNMRTAFINGTGRSDVTFPDDVNECFAINTTNLQMFKREEYYFQPFSMLKHFKFSESELSGLYTNAENPSINGVLAVFSKLCKVEEDTGDDLENKVTHAVQILPRIKEIMKGSSKSKQLSQSLPADQPSIRPYSIPISSSVPNSSSQVESVFPF